MDCVDMSKKIAVVIPSFKVSKHILGVIAGIGHECCRIYVVDDCCPEGSGKLVQEECKDDRVKVIFHERNMGVGGAVISGYREAVKENMDIAVKIDGDGQMDPSLIAGFVAPIIANEADYTKGNRFFSIESLNSMPMVRMIGNAVLSFMAKLSTGYWDLFDPTNGYTAISVNVIRCLPLEKLSNRYFFETDMLFRLNTLRAVVLDVPIDAKYEDEVSNLKIGDIWGEFLIKHTRNFIKRIFYSYYLRGMSVASIELPLGLLMCAFGAIYGGVSWASSLSRGEVTPAGTVMVAALPILLGLQLILAFVAYDINSVPRHPIHLFSLIKCSRKQ